MVLGWGAIELAVAACGGGGASDQGDATIVDAAAADADPTAPPAGPPISATMYSTFFLRDGVALGCGSNALGHLGVDDAFEDIYRQPAPLAFPPGVEVAQVSAGGHGGAAIDTAGGVWVWGGNGTGELGLGTLDDLSLLRPQRVELDGAGAPFGGAAQLAIGYQTVGVRKLDGTVWAWGLNGSDGFTHAHGMTGQPIPDGGCPWGGGGAAGCYTLAPTQVAFPPGVVVRELVASDFTFIALDTEDRLWSWGGDASPSTTSSHVPVQFAELPPIRAVAAGRVSFLAIDRDDRVWSWRHYGALEELTAAPAFAQFAGRAQAVSISGHAAHLLDVDGQLWGWGDNQLGEVGHAAPGLDPQHVDEAGCRDASYDYVTTAMVDEPQPILDDVAGVYAASYAYSVFAIRRDGTVWAWGRNKAFGLCNDPPPIPDCGSDPVPPHPDAYNVGVPVQITPW